MTTSLTPAKRLTRLFSDWLRPDSLAEGTLLDLESNLFPQKSGFTLPRVNIREMPGEFILEVAAPGLQQKDFRIELDNHILSISSEKEEHQEDKEETNGYTRREYSYHAFSRSFEIPANVNEDKIGARYDKGILTLTLPKTTEAVPKRVREIHVS